MVSGDHIDTCKNIAIEAGIITQREADEETNVVMTGHDFQSAIGDFYVEKNEETGEREVKFEDPKKMKNVIRTVKVIGRATDQDKNLIVAAIKTAGGFILMSGDGINDTEALSLAHVGVSMGSSC